MFDKTGTITKGVPEVTRVWMRSDTLNPIVLLSAIGCAETNSEHPIAAAIIKFVREALKSDLVGISSNFQAVPGCGMKCVVSSISPLIKNAKNSTEINHFVTLVTSGSSGLFTLNGIEVEVNQSQSMRLGQLIGMQSGGGGGDEGDGVYEVVIGNREWMSRNGFFVTEEVDGKMMIEEEQGRSAVLCAINGRVILFRPPLNLRFYLLLSVRFYLSVLTIFLFNL